MRGRFMRQRFTVLLVTLTVATTSLLVGCDLLNLFAFLGGAGIGAGVGQPGGAQSAGALLTGSEPGSAMPGDQVLLKGERLLSPASAQEAVAQFDGQDLSLPVLDITDETAAVIVPALTAGQYAVRIRYPGGETTTSVQLTIQGLPAPTLTATEAADRVNGNLGALATGLRDDVDGASHSGSLSPDVSSAIDQAVAALSPLFDDIAADIRAMSPDELSLLEHVLSSSDFLKELSSATPKAKARMKVSADTHRALFAMDATGFVVGNFAAFCKTSGYVFVLTPPLMKVAPVLLKIGSACGLLKDFLELVPCDLTSVRTMEPFLTLDAGASHELVILGDFEAESTVDEFAAGLVLDKMLEGWKPFGKANSDSKKAAEAVVKDTVGKIIEMIGGRVDDAVSIINIKAAPVKDVRLDMNLYNIAPGELAQSALAGTPIGVLAPAVVAVLRLPDWTDVPSVRPSDAAVFDVQMGDANVIVARGEGKADLYLRAVSFETRKGELSWNIISVARGYLGEFLGVVDVSLHESNGYVTVRAAVPPPPVCGNGVCENGEAHDSCPADCPVTGPVCGNGTCESGENSTNCPQDCPVTPVCGDGICNGSESSSTCPQDCPVQPVCGDGICSGSETNATCPQDCPAAGDGDTAASATTLQFTGNVATVTGSLPPGDIVDYYKFSVNSDRAVITISTTVTAGSGGGDVEYVNTNSTPGSGWFMGYNQTHTFDEGDFFSTRGTHYVAAHKYPEFPNTAISYTITVTVQE